MSRAKATKPEVEKELDLAKIAANVPDENVFVLGDHKFLLKDFKYKDYMQFVKYLAPLFDTFTSKLVPLRSFNVDESKALNAMNVLTFCEDTLPKMGLMVVHNTYPDMSEDDMLDLFPSPFDLANLVLAQIVHNQIIEKLAAFLAQMTPRKTA